MRKSETVRLDAPQGIFCYKGRGDVRSYITDEVCCRTVYSHTVQLGLLKCIYILISKCIAS